jgi:CRP-like cAMP-binding protein
VTRSPVTRHELAQVVLLAGLPEETLGELAQRMERWEVAPGMPVVREGEAGDRFFVILDGMLSVANRAMGARDVLRSGDYFGEVSVTMDLPRTATVTAITPAVVASCDRATFDEFLRPIFALD